MPNDFQNMLQLARLSLARRDEIIDELEYSRRSTSLLDRAGWKEVTIIDFLTKKSLSEGDLAIRAAKFGKFVADAYQQRYQAPPPQRLQMIKPLGEARAVNVYLEWDFSWLEELYVDCFSRRRNSR